MGYSIKRINVYEGGVAFGHQVGSSGARIVITLVNKLTQKHGVYRATGICNHEGEARAIIIKRIV